MVPIRSRQASSLAGPAHPRTALAGRVRNLPSPLAKRCPHRLRPRRAGRRSARRSIRAACPDAARSTRGPLESSREHTTLQLLDVEADRTLQVGDELWSPSWASTSSPFLAADLYDEGVPQTSRLRVFEYDGQVEQRWATECGAWAQPDLSPDGSAILATDGERVHRIDESGARVVDVGHSPRWRPAPG